MLSACNGAVSGGGHTGDALDQNANANRNSGLVGWWWRTRPAARNATYAKALALRKIDSGTPGVFTCGAPQLLVTTTSLLLGNGFRG